LGTLCRTCQSKASNKDTHKRRERNLKDKYGISLEDYEVMLVEQKGCCAICGVNAKALQKEERRPLLFVDHCHATGKIRALLCSKCNSGLGFFDDRPDLLEKARKYIKRFAE